MSNFNIVLLVGLMICAIGISPSTALMCKMGEELQTCAEDKPVCKVTATGTVGCCGVKECPDGKVPDTPLSCKDNVCCCNADMCNDLTGAHGKAICDAIPTLKCTGGDGGGQENSGIATGLFRNYYGSFLLVTLVSASMYLIPLNA